jgi:hypothetical protein
MVRLTKSFFVEVERRHNLRRYTSLEERCRVSLRSARAPASSCTSRESSPSMHRRSTRVGIGPRARRCPVPCPSRGTDATRSRLLPPRVILHVSRPLCRRVSSPHAGFCFSSPRAHAKHASSLVCRPRVLHQSSDRLVSVRDRESIAVQRLAISLKF